MQDKMQGPKIAVLHAKIPFHFYEDPLVKAALKGL